MSDAKNPANADQGVHYHYHFYGYGAAPAAMAAPAEGTAPQSYGVAGTPAGTFEQTGAWTPGAGGAAGGFGAGAPGFPFVSGAGAAPDAATGTARSTGSLWHQHPNADSLIKGLVVGAGAAYLLTNETAQRAIMRTAVHVWGFLQGSIEELKERLHDAEAEVAAAATPAEPAVPEAEVPATGEY